MSFSSEVKAEIISSRAHCAGCLKARLLGMLLLSRNIEGAVCFQTENLQVMEHFIDLLDKLCQIRVSLEESEIFSSKGIKLYTVEAAGVSLDRLTLKRRCCMGNLLAGVFLANGTITDPQKGYHLEIYAQDRVMGDSFRKFLLRHAGINLKALKLKRKNEYGFYQKNSFVIEDILTLMGAVKSALSVMDIKIEKEIRNKANRITNCDTANITRAVEAASKYAEDIRYIETMKGADFLTEELKKAALLRLDYPEASLSELAALWDGQISRSALNRRLDKIRKIAQEIRAKS